MAELINAFKKAQLKDFHLSCKPVMLRNSFSLKHLSMATGYFWTYYDQSLSELCLFMEVRYRISPPKKYSLNFIEYLTAKKKKHFSTQNIFHISKF